MSDEPKQPTPDESADQEAKQVGRFVLGTISILKHLDVKTIILISMLTGFGGPRMLEMGRMLITGVPMSQTIPSSLPQQSDVVPQQACLSPEVYDATVAALSSSHQQTSDRLNQCRALLEACDKTGACEP